MPMKKKLNCVLLVDDNESDNYLHKKVLEQSGLVNHVEIAMDGEAAIEFLNSNYEKWQSSGVNLQPELIFLDINMPVMDGWTFLEEYDKLEDVLKSKIVFVMLTTSINPADKRRVEKREESVDFLYKPLTLKMINEIIQKRFPENL